MGVSPGIPARMTLDGMPAYTGRAIARRTRARHTGDIAVSIDQSKSENRRQVFLLLGGLALLKVAVHLSTMGLGPYGYFRDEFYYLDCAQNLDWGYVDQPPLSLLILAITRFIAGPSILAIRTPAILAGAATVLFTGLIAREMGGSRFSQTLACLAVIAAPICLTMSSFFSMNPFDYLFWTLDAWILVRIIRTGNMRLWLWFGLVAGLGLENKLSMGFFGAALALSLLLTPQRRNYFDKNIWIGGAIALVLLLPNVAWQMRNGWPTLEFMHDTNLYKNMPITLSKFLFGQILIIGPLTAPIWIAGILYGFVSRSGRPFRVFSLAYVVLFAVFYATNGKSYYLAPIYPVLLAMGAVWIEAALTSRRVIRWAYAVVVVIAGAILAPHAMPILSPDSLISYQKAMHLKSPQQERAHAGVLPQHIGDRLGWEEFVEFVSDAYHKLDPADRERCAILVSNYGEAGSINLLGPNLGLPRAISGYMSYYLWGPGDATGDVVLAYWDKREALEEVFEEVIEVGRFSHPYVMERQDNRPLYLCMRPRMPLAEAWPQFKRYW